MPLFEPETRSRFGTTWVKMEIPSELSYKDAAIIRILRCLQEHEYVGRDDMERVRLSLDEAIKNAMMHGNHYDPRKNIRIRLYGDDSKWAILIEDEGNGMRPERVPKPLFGEQDLRESGYGIILMESVQDEVVYMGRGNQLLMTRRRSPDAGPEGGEGLVDVAVPSEDDVFRAQYVTPAAQLSHVPASLDFEAEADAAPTRPDAVQGGPAPEAPMSVPGATVESETRQLRILRKGQTRVLELQDRSISDANLSQVREQLVAAAQGQTVLVVDLRHVQYVSSIVLGAFVSLYKELRQSGASVGFASLNPPLREVFRATRLDMLLPVFQDPETALQNLSK
ncbi:MAG: ATP-binding protein [Planctomycetes bacterium]|nr:ATP-binding protein [Planctomycetota bacterium]